MPHYSVVHEGSGWTLGLWRCAQPEPGGHGPERTSRHQIVFPTHGAYARTIEGRREILDVSRVVYFNAGEWYEVDHPVGGGDRCIVLSLEPALLEDLAAEDRGIGDRPGSGPRFAQFSRVSSGPLHLAVRMLAARTQRAGPDPVATDTQAYGILAAACPVAVTASGREHPGFAGRAAQLHRRAVERALAKIHADHARPLSLEEIARAAAYSPFHLSRVFRAHVGVTLHRYLNRIRLREALEEVSDGAADLGVVALRHGFSSHSHFTDAFRREFGRTPRAVRAGVRR